MQARAGPARVDAPTSGAVVGRSGAYHCPHGGDTVNAIRSTWPRERRRELAIEPTEPRPLGPRTLAAYAAAVVVPVAVGAAVIPWRDNLTHSTALILVLPVLLVALAGGIGPGLPAAAASPQPVTFDLLLTRPYLGFSIHDNDDVVADDERVTA